MIRKSLTRPILLFECERIPLILIVGELGYVILFSIGKLRGFFDYLILIALILAIPASIIGLQALARIDPQFSKIYLRSRRFPRKISGYSHPRGEARYDVTNF